MSNRDGIIEARAKFVRSILECKIKIQEIEDEIKHHQEAVGNCDVVLDGMRSFPQEVTDDQIHAVKQRMVERDGINLRVRQNDKRKETQDLFETAQLESVRLSTAITVIDHEKADALSKATFPLPELSVNETEVMYEGKGLAQVSDGEAIRIGVALNMALNPALQIILIRRASLLDCAGHDVVMELAKKHDYLVICEENDESGEMGS